MILGSARASREIVAFLSAVEYSMIPLCGSGWLVRSL